MAEVTMPRLSDTMTEGHIAEWLKKEGDKVEKGDMLLEIETDKATMTQESYDAGILEKILVQTGQTVPIGTPIAIIGSGASAGVGTAAPAPAAPTPGPAPADNPALLNPAPITQAAAPASRGKEVAMPRLSDTMEEGTIGQWLKKEGDRVEKGDVLL